MDRRKETKTFGLRTPTDLHYKLLFDIERLRFAGKTAEARYAAFDCAVDAWHLVDWTLHAVPDADHKRLTDYERSYRPKRGEPSIVSSFTVKQRDQLPALKYCRILANSVKHREVENDTMSNFWTGSTNIFSWSEPAANTGERSIKAITLLTYVEVDNKRHNAVGLFEDMAGQWQTFLDKEGLFEPRPDYPEEE